MWIVFQTTDDIVLMAQSLEKVFLQKVAQMPRKRSSFPLLPLKAEEQKPSKDVEAEVSYTVI